MSKEKSSFRFNFLDLLLVILAVAVLLGGAYYYFGGFGGRSQGEDVTVTYTVEFTNVPSYLLDKPQVGDVVKDSVRLYHIGTITQVAYEPYLMTLVNEETGELVQAETPGRMNILLTIQAAGKLKNNQVEIDGFAMSVGVRVNVRSAHYVGSGFCTAMSYK
ncbi:MAG: DUF4330 domain-containing protein [Clostridia bacterium]|nr:DUF4330 domain-containing protein [Clostridia bacterium]